MIVNMIGRNPNFKLQYNNDQYYIKDDKKIIKNDYICEINWHRIIKRYASLHQY